MNCFMEVLDSEDFFMYKKRATENINKLTVPVFKNGNATSLTYFILKSFVHFRYHRKIVNFDIINHVFSENLIISLNR